ncbi:phage distal tail protein [Streptomyces sp. NPDC096033]|uniref:phage distal tail protein n=1 Tax=Streptomyces sp. NPDC096033 TaxID=3366071 RepID=UPI003822DDEE
MPYIPGTNLGGRRVDLGALSLGAVDTAGVAWHLQELEGWDSPEVRSDYSEREADHGAWAAPVYLGQRPITLAGKIEAPDPASLDGAMEQLLAAASLTDTTLVVYETTPKQAVVRRSGKTLARPITDRIAAYSLLLTAADPRRYSTTLQAQSTGLPSVVGGLILPITPPLTIDTTVTGGGFTLANEGSIGTRPVFTITGPADQPVITCTQPDGTVIQLAYSGTLGVGDVLSIDCDAHTVSLSGVSRRRYLSALPYWPEIAPASTLSVQWFATSYDPAALLTGTCRSAWM